MRLPFFPVGLFVYLNRALRFVWHFADRHIRLIIVFFAPSSFKSFDFAERFLFLRGVSGFNENVYLESFVLKKRKKGKHGQSTIDWCEATENEREESSGTQSL